jgi:ankyrin repeat protein
VKRLLAANKDQALSQPRPGWTGPTMAALNRDDDGWTPEMLKNVLEALPGADQADEQGRTVLTLTAGSPVPQWDPSRAESKSRKVREGPLRMLLESKKVNVNLQDKEGRTALMYATVMQHEAAVIMLLETRADVTLCDKAGGNALNLSMEQSSAQASSESVLRLLLEAGIQTNVCAKDVRSPLMAAAWYGCTIALRMLLDAGAELDLKDEDGETALTLAAFKGYSEEVQMLLSSGADANVSRSDGRAAIMLSAIEGKEEVVRMLLNAGADANLRCKSGKTALMYAEQYEHGVCATLLG